MTKHEAGAVAPSSGRVARPSPPSPEGQDDIVRMLSESVKWHTQQGRPYSASVDQDAIDLITRLRTDRAGVVECWERINALIVKGPLPGNGTDKSAERNGIVLAANAIFDLAFPLSPPSPSSASEWRTIMSELADAAYIDMKCNQAEDKEHEPGGWWSLRTENAILAVRALLAALPLPPSPTTQGVEASAIGGSRPEES